MDSSHLDDRQIVRRMVLKRCVHGVDKNPMAVELAKVSLWLHTFTVGAPLSFLLDHHLRCGDSLFGSWVDEGVERAEARGGGGMLFLQEPMDRGEGGRQSDANDRGAVGRGDRRGGAVRGAVRTCTTGDGAPSCFLIGVARAGLAGARC